MLWMGVPELFNLLFKIFTQLSTSLSQISRFFLRTSNGILDCTLEFYHIYIYISCDFLRPKLRHIVAGSCRPINWLRPSLGRPFTHIVCISHMVQHPLILNMVQPSNIWLKFIYQKATNYASIYNIFLPFWLTTDTWFSDLKGKRQMPPLLLKPEKFLNQTLFPPKTVPLITNFVESIFSLLS